MLLFADPQLCEQTCSYATRAVDAGTIKDDKPLEADDEVEFEVRPAFRKRALRHCAAGTYRLICTAAWMCIAD